MVETWMWIDEKGAMTKTHYEWRTSCRKQSNDDPKSGKIAKQIMSKESFSEEIYFDKYFKVD